MSTPRKLTIEHVRQLAEQRNGKLLTTEYLNSRQKFQFECYKGHVFTARFHKIESGSWCPECRIYIGEAISREVMKTLFGADFKKIRPEWLDGLELDGYNAKLRIAFEYDGAQHYKFVKHIHKNIESFLDQQTRDVRKNELCKTLNITLIRIPYTVQPKDIADFVREQCKNNKIHIPNDVVIDHTKFCGIYGANNHMYQNLKEIVEEKNGILMSDSYVGAFDDVMIRCEKEHIFRASYNGIKYKNAWCFLCGGGKIKCSIDELNETLKCIGVQCVADEYPGVASKTTFACNCGNIWNTTIKSIIKGARCPECFPETIRNDAIALAVEREKIKKGERKESLEKRRLLQKSMILEKVIKKVSDNKGRILSRENVCDDTTKIQIECKNSHVINKTIHDLLYTKSWCHSCASGKKSIDNMHTLAKQHEGKCLSTVYVNNTIHLEWECKNGHIFKKAPVTIVAKKLFCTTCSKSKKTIKDA